MLLFKMCGQPLLTVLWFRHNNQKGRVLRVLQRILHFLELYHWLQKSVSLEEIEKCPLAYLLFK